VNDVGRMIQYGGGRRRELQIDRDGARSKGGPNRAKNPLGRSERAGQPAQALSRPVRAHLPPHGSSWHFELCPLDLCHFEVVIPVIKIGGLLV
jgi:hypothetical protein